MATLLEMMQAETAARIAVMQAWLDGKTIVTMVREGQFDNKWHPINYPSWDWSHFNYKVQE